MSYTKEMKITEEETIILIKIMRGIRNNKIRRTDKNMVYVLANRVVGKTLEQIAKELNLSRERIRQLEAKGIEYIKKYIRTNESNK